MKGKNGSISISRDCHNILEELKIESEILCKQVSEEHNFSYVSSKCIDRLQDCKTLKTAMCLFWDIWK